MKTNITRLCATLLLTASVVSCTDGFEELNRNPLTPPYVNSGSGGGEQPEVPGQTTNNEDITPAESISAEELEKLRTIESALGANLRKLTYEGLVDDYQRSTNLTHDIYAGYFAHNKPDFNSASPCYIYTPDWSDRRWNHFYKERTDEYRTIIKIARYLDRDRYHNIYYATRIYYAFLISTLTDTYGDLPIAEAILGLPLPEHATYQTQQVVYDKILRMIAEAVEAIDPARSGYTPEATDDLAFGGDFDRWRRFGNSLRLRLALRISNVDPERARREGEAAMAHPAGLMRGHEDRMRTVPAYAPIALGGVDDSGRENEVANCSRRYRDAVMSKDLELAYKGLSSELDPRCPISWFRPSPEKFLNNDMESTLTDYTGCHIGDHDVEHTTDKYSILKANTLNAKELRDDFWFGYSREYLWFGYSELKFLLAEAALRGWSGAGGSAEQLYLDGIRASMSYYHLPTAQAEAYISGLKSNPWTGSDREAQLEAIITQKWLAIFPNGNEGWAEFRRTDYPRLLYPFNTNDPGIPVGKFIKCVSYPNDERANNSANVPATTQGTRLWWDVQDTNATRDQRNTPNNFR